MRLAAARRKPPRSAPKMLFLPNRERLEAAFRDGAQKQAWKDDGPVVVELSAMELSVEYSIHGRMKCLTACYWRPDGKNKVLEHMMPEHGTDADALLAVAEMHGRNAQKICLPLAYKMAGTI